MGIFLRTSRNDAGADSVRIIAVIAITVSSLCLAGWWAPIGRGDQLLGIQDEDDASAPVDYGPGPGIRRIPQSTARRLSAVQLASRRAERRGIPEDDPGANITGEFGPAITWPLIPIHAVLLPDGRVMNYGTSAKGAQGSLLIYDVWDPTLGTDTDSHLVLPNTTNTDIFCSAQSVMLSGNVLASGGALTINRARNSAINNTTIFSPIDNSLISNTPMTYARWYGTLLAMPSGQLTIFGGRQNVGALTPPQPAMTPELYDPIASAWTTLPGATSSAAYGTSGWYYPRAYVAPGGQVFVIGHNGQMFYVSTDGDGAVVKSSVVAPLGNVALPTVSFAPGFVLSLRNKQAVSIVDYRTSTPVVTPTDPIDQVRYWSSGTVMADGKVLITGGSQVLNSMTGAAYQAQMWDPATGHWTAGATATKPRLYHSVSLLLPDGSVLTGGGGAPGPFKNLNAEIFYPPYLYASDGTAAIRPAISSVDSTVLNPGDTLSIWVGPDDSIGRLTFVRTGSATHSNDADQRFIDLPYSQDGQNVTAVLPTDTSVLVPGYYLVFAFNTDGVPSVASIVSVQSSMPAARIKGPGRRASR